MQHLHRRTGAPSAVVRGIAGVCAVVGLAVLGIGLGACGGDKNEAAPQATPAPTNHDPGPNDTSNGPVTVEGVVHLDPVTGCISVTSDQGTLGLAFTDYEIGTGPPPALVEKGSGRVLAHEGDTLIVTGANAGTTPAACGTPFTVQSLTSVLPAK